MAASREVAGLFFAQHGRILADLHQELLPVRRVFAEIVPESGEVPEVTGAPLRGGSRRCHGRVPEMIVEEMPLVPGTIRPRVREMRTLICPALLIQAARTSIPEPGVHE
jgi:hypothetical protein